MIYSLAFAAKPPQHHAYLASSPSGMTSSETLLYKTSYYECLQTVVARLYDTSHELCGITLAAQAHAQLLAFS